MKTDYFKSTMYSPWFSQGRDFFFDWLQEINAEQRKRTKNQRRGMPYKRTLKKWRNLWCDDDLADIARVAVKIMDAVKTAHPEIGQYL